ncbi:MAG: topoisomerase C-terminal repeat-containing protein, partial [Chitinophagaceae bacterium]
EKDISVNIGRFGPYVKWGEEFISIPRGTDLSAVDLGRAIQLIEEKKHADAPVAMYDGKPVTKGKGRFGPFIKWEGMFINVPKRYNYDALSQADINELIDAKVKKEANRFIQKWPEEKIAVENGRWGPFIRFGKKMLKIPKKADDTKYTAEEAATFSLDDVKKMIEVEIPGAFTKKEKKPGAKKKAVTKKAPKKKK